MKRLFWLASYPKSGNTWLRLFLANLVAENGGTVGINQISLGVLDNERRAFDQLIGTNSDELTHEQVDRLRPEAYRLLARRLDRRVYCKTHDAYRIGEDRGLFPSDVTEAAIYLVRNPFDLALSCAYYFETPIDAMIMAMGNRLHALSGRTDRYQPLLRQSLGTWSDHVAGWLKVVDFPVLVVRYEDLVEAPQEGFLRIARFAGLSTSPERIASAIRQTRFEKLQDEERASGFRENLSAAPMFFRRGRVGSWRQELTAGQVGRIVRDHRAVAERLGYVDAEGRPSVATLGERLSP